MNAPRITARKLNHALRKAGARANEISEDTLNYGGCCVYAALVGEHLQKLGITVGAMVRGRNPHLNLADVRQNVRDVGDTSEWNNNGVYFRHVGLEYVISGRAYHCDSDYVTSADSHPSLCDVHAGRLTVDEAKKLASTENGWNWMFDRELIPAITAAVAEVFAPLYPTQPEGHA